MSSCGGETLVRVGVSGEVVTEGIHSRKEEVLPAYHNPVEFRRLGKLKIQFRLELAKE